MSNFKTSLLEKQEVARDTMAFYFARPDGYQFKAGQHSDWFLITPPETDAEGDIRTFSLAGAPFEDRLMIATRLRDTAFKRVLRNLPVGSEVETSTAYGSMVLHQNVSRPAAFLAGGIGITPFLSMALQAAHDRLPHEIYLFYSNRTEEDAPFLPELRQLAQVNSRFHLVSTMTGAAGAGWNGERGYISPEMLRRHLPDLSSPIYYIAGPPAMVGALGKMLETAGVSRDDVRIEEFAGY